MITFDKLRFRNFMSYGGAWSELTLNDCQLTAIAAKNASGKCVDPSTVIEVRFESAKTVELFKQRNQLTVLIPTGPTSYDGSVTIGQIYDLFHADQSVIGTVFVRTRFGYRMIEACDITAYDSEVIEIVAQNGDTIRTSPDHLLYTGQYWTRVRDLKVGDHVAMIDGTFGVSNINRLPNRANLFDIQVAQVHEYYGNRFVSHNSSILNALSFGLYGKSFSGISKGKLVNSINGKQLEVHVEFTSDHDHYKVVRGIKPAIFQIYKNDKLINEESNSRDYQAILESQILRMSFKTFIQTVVIGTASFTPFMELSAVDRRVIVEDLLGVGILTTMNSLLKEKIAANQQSQIDNRYKIDAIKVQIISDNQVIKTLKNSHKNTVEQLIDQKNSINEKIKTINKEIDKINQQLAKLSPANQKYDTIRANREKIVNQITEAKTLIRQLSNEKSFVISHDSCPTCKQKIDQQYRQSIISKADDQLATHKQTIDELQAKLESITDKQNKLLVILDRITQLNRQVTENNVSITMLNNQVIEIDNRLNQHEDKSLIAEKELDIRRKIDQAKVLLESKETLLNEKQIYDQSANLLRDSGIKTAVVNQYLPIINQMINKYLADMDFYLSFELDSQFNETIKARGRDDLTYQNLSQGEKRRLDMAIIFTWRYIAQLRNSCTCQNIFVDEILDSSLDGQGVDSIMQLFRSFNDSHVVVISHRESIQDLELDKVVPIEKRDQFSTITVS